MFLPGPHRTTCQFSGIRRGSWTRMHDTGCSSRTSPNEMEQLAYRAGTPGYSSFRAAMSGPATAAGPCLIWQSGRTSVRRCPATSGANGIVLVLGRVHLLELAVEIPL